MRRPTRTTILAGGLMAAIATGCAVVQHLSFTEPTVDLAAVHVRDLTLAGGSLDLILAIHNPNPYRIAGKEFTATVDLEGTRFGSITRQAPWLLPAGADTSLTLRLDFGWNAVGAAARALLDRGRVQYAIEGEMRVGTTADDRRFAIRRAGEVPLARLLQ
jgi:LEA14-like dessication related protein